MTKKRRVPPTPDISAAVRHASDNTCCHCRTPGQPLQLHHLDENPANNDPDNLAVLCLTCHNLTQVRGGFGRRLDEALVRLYRDEWLVIVQAKRAQQASFTPDTQSGSVSGPRLTAEQAREKAAYLRALYGEFLLGIDQMHIVSVTACEALERGADVGAWLSTQEPTINQAAARLGRTAYQIRVEPGSDEVCAAYDEYQAISRRHTHEILKYAQAPSPLARTTVAWYLDKNTKRQLQAAYRKMQGAARRHISAMDHLARGN